MKSMRSVVAVVKGGLGNQLFIYAAARALALRTGRRLLLDIESYARDGFSRTFRLDRFPIEARVLGQPLPVASSRAWRHRQLRSLSRLLPLPWRGYVREGIGVQRFAALAPRRARVILDGYWQDEGYFAEHASRIRRELTPPAPVGDAVLRLGARLAGCDGVFVHVRRQRYRYLLPKDYYQRAIDAICDRVAKPCFLVLGDDPDWVQRNLDFRGRSFEPGFPDEDELADLWLMTRCRHAIIANSTFSWWGAWLQAGDRNSLVVAPAQTGFPLAMPARWQLVPNAVVDKGQS